MLLSFILMVLSSIIAGWSDINSFVPKDPADLVRFNLGYAWMALNCLFSAGYVLFMRKRIKHFNFKDFDTVYYNNVLSLPVMLTLSFCLEGWTSGEFGRTFAVDVRSALTVAVVLSGVSSFLISYGSAWCVRCTSSTTYSMVGALNKLPVAASGILFLGDPATAGNILGIAFGFIAGLLYSYSKTDQAQKNFALANNSSLSNSAKSDASIPSSGNDALALSSLTPGIAPPTVFPYQFTSPLINSVASTVAVEMLPHHPEVSSVLGLDARQDVHSKDPLAFKASKAWENHDHKKEASSLPVLDPTERFPFN
ncbi:GDP-mannose transporter into the lumen of the Golgi [Entomortierella chlamydospora]|nr:GDP-mannose transporter into the lumen of the Golgi [Entomortierella chlamydospora]